MRHLVAGGEDRLALARKRLDRVAGDEERRRQLQRGQELEQRAARRRAPRTLRAATSPGSRAHSRTTPTARRSRTSGRRWSWAPRGNVASSSGAASARSTRSAPLAAAVVVEGIEDRRRARRPGRRAGRRAARRPRRRLRRPRPRRRARSLPELGARPPRAAAVRLRVARRGARPRGRGDAPVARRLAARARLARRAVEREADAPRARRDRAGRAGSPCGRTTATRCG